MFNGRNPDKLCKQQFETKTVVLVIIMSIIFNLLLSNKADLIPFNIDELSPSSKS
jgi:hypothetical protein